MPIYGYRCQACGHEFEVTQRMSDPAEAACPECGGAGSRLFFPAGILFKGSGFYKTDSRSASTATASSSSNGQSTSDAGSASKPSTDTTPAASPSPAPAKASPAAPTND